MFLFEDIAKDFYYCTSIPILVLNKNFELIFNYNYTKENLNTFSKEGIIHKIKETKNHNPINIKSGNNLIYSAIPVTTNKDLNKDGIIYIKNECCINYLRDLLTLIAKDKFMSMHCEYAYSPFVLNAIKHIHDNYDEEIDMESLCSKFNINKSYFCNVFKKETGLTFTNFLNTFRVEKSKEMLKHTQYSLLDIALATGFKNQSYYSTTFKKITGISPIDYRKKEA